MRSTSRSSRTRSGSRFGKTFSALAIAILGALPALLIASSARASGSLVVEDWTMGALLGFRLMDPLAASVVGVMVLKLGFETAAEALAPAGQMQHAHAH